MYSSRILKSRYISVLEPVSIDTPVEEDTIISEEDENITEEEVVIDPQSVADEIIAKAKEEAQALMEDCQHQIEEMKTKLKQESDLYGEKVKEAAYDEGYSKGYAEGKASLSGAIDEIHNESLKLQESYKLLLDNSEAQIVELVLAVAKKVIDEDVKLNKDNMLRIIRQALNLSYDKQSAMIKVSAKDYEYLCDNDPDLISQINSYENTSIKEDMTLKEGDCIVDTPFGTVDMGIDKRFEKISEEFTKDLVN